MDAGKTYTTKRKKWQKKAKKTSIKQLSVQYNNKTKYSLKNYNKMELTQLQREKIILTYFGNC